MKKIIDEKVVLDIFKCFVLPTLILSFVFNYKTYTLLHHYEKKKKLLMKILIIIVTTKCLNYDIFNFRLILLS